MKHPNCTVILVKKFWKLSQLFLIGSLMTCCTQNAFDTSEALWKHLKEPNNEYLQTKVVNGIVFSLLYKPTDLIVDQEIGEPPTDSSINALRNKYKDHLYFILSMAKNNQELLSNVAGNKQRFGAMVNELAFDMDQKVHVYTPTKDTILLTDFIYPRMYGISGSTSILFVYPRDKKIMEQEYVNFTIQDLGFATGEVKFKIPTSIIKNEPIIEFN